MRGNIRSLALAAALLSVPTSAPPDVITVPFKPTDANDGSSKRRRESRRGGRRYSPKVGNSDVDNARRERAEAKRQRKALARRPSAGGRQP